MLKLANIFSPNGIGPKPYDPVNPVGFSGKRMFDPNQINSPVMNDGPQQQDNVQQALGQQPQIPPFDTGDSQLQQMLNPRDELFNRFTDLIKQIPQQKDYQPSKMRKVGGFLANLGSGGPVGISGGQPIGYKSDIEQGLKNQNMINDEPFNKALQAWAREEGPTLEAAKLENVKNTNSRVGALGLRNTQLREEGLARQRNWDTTRAEDLAAKESDREKRTEISQQRAAAYEYDKMHPNHQYKTDQDGNVYSIDPKSNQVEYLTDQKGNYIKSDKLPDEMKAKLNQRNALEQIGARGSEARKTEVVRQSGRESLEDQKTANKQILGTGVGKPESAGQKKVGQYSRAQQAYNTRPEWAQYVHLSPGNNFTLAVPSGGNQKTYNDVYRYVYGEEPKTGAQAVIYKNGKAFTVPIENVDRAVNELGYSYKK